MVMPHAHILGAKVMGAFLSGRVTSHVRILTDRRRRPRGVRIGETARVVYSKTLTSAGGGTRSPGTWWGRGWRASSGRGISWSGDLGAAFMG
jgi:hypothetical protein